MLALERLARLDQKAEAIARNLCDGNLGANHVHLKTLFPSKFSSKKVCRVLNCFGQPSNSILEEKQVFRDNFSSQLDGTQMPFQEVIEIDRECLTEPLSVSPASVERTAPLIGALAHKFASKNPKKGFGESLLSGAIYKK